MELELDEVVRLQASYSYTHDHGDVAEFIELFTVDAVFVLPSGQEIAGRDALVEWVETSKGAGVHTSGAPLVAEDGTARTSFVFVARGNVKVSSGYYHDTFARSARGGLVFRRRLVETFTAADQEQQ